MIGPIKLWQIPKIDERRSKLAILATGDELGPGGSSCDRALCCIGHRLRQRPKSVALEHKSNKNADNAQPRQTDIASITGYPCDVGHRLVSAMLTGKRWALLVTRHIRFRRIHRTRCTDPVLAGEDRRAYSLVTRRHYACRARRDWDWLIR